MSEEQPNDQQPDYPQYPPSRPPKRPWYKRTWKWYRARSRQTQIIIAAIIILFIAFSGIVAAMPGAPLQNSTATPAPTKPAAQQNSQPTQAPAQPTQARPTQAPTLAPTDTPTLVLTATPQSIHYPPTTGADLHSLATEGDASAIHEFHSESVGAVGACPQPKREVTVDPSVTGQQLAEDLLAYFYAQQLDSPCGSVIFAYHNQGEAGDVYTAGRILLDVTDSSGQVNFDPNATNLKYTLTLDIGGLLTNQQEYVITY